MKIVVFVVTAVLLASPALGRPTRFCGVSVESPVTVLSL